MKRTAIVLLALAAGCGGSTDPEPAAQKKTCAPTAGAVEPADLAPPGTASRVRVAPGMELKATKRNLAAARIGEPLVVNGMVRGEDCAPLAGATIHVWQANGRERYGPIVGGQDRCCYVAGTVLTGDDGTYALDTVMPRGYDGGPAHIHMIAGHPETEGLATELLFGAEANPQAVTVEVRDGAAELDIVLRDS